MKEIATGERNKQIQEISSRKVAEHNDLISSVAKMDKTPLKMFELAVSCIDTDAPPKDNTVFLSVLSFLHSSLGTGIDQRYKMILLKS